VVVRALAPRRSVELGTSNGYSTIWLADAVCSGGGSLVSVEIDTARAALARKNFARAGVEGVVELRIEDAGRTLSASADAEWDNVISHASELTEFRQLVAADERVMETLCPVGAGVRFVVREGG
jgi:predicted O-methyltransferase YrrM